jgi:hypothetical protein
MTKVLVHRACAALALVLVALTATACGAGPTKPVSKADFSITPAEGWHEAKGDQIEPIASRVRAGTDAVLMHRGSDNERAVLTVTRIGPAELPDWARQLDRIAQATMYGLAVAPNRPLVHMAVDRAPAVRFDVPVTSKDGVHLTERVIIALRGSRAYMIAFAAKPEPFAQQRDHLDAMLRSFRWRSAT